MIEISAESSCAPDSAVVVRCAESGCASAVVRSADLALRLGHQRLVVDIGTRDAADADLLNALHHSGRRMRDAGGRLRVVCADSGLHRLLDLTLLSQGFSVYATREEALAG